MLSRIEGERVNLRRITVRDAADIYRNVKHRDINRHTFIPHPYTRKHAEEFIKRTHLQWRKKTAYNLGIEDCTTGHIIGMIGLEGISQKHRRGEIGYWLSKAYWGQGIMAEALLLALRFYFKELKLRRVVAHVFPENSRSGRLLEKIGFTYEGRLRKHIFKGNRWRDLLSYGILREEFLK